MDGKSVEQKENSHYADGNECSGSMNEPPTSQREVEDHQIRQGRSVGGGQDDKMRVQQQASERENVRAGRHRGPQRSRKEEGK